MSIISFAIGITLLATMPVKHTCWSQTFVSILIKSWVLDMSFSSGIIVFSNSAPECIKDSRLCCATQRSIIQFPSVLKWRALLRVISMTVGGTCSKQTTGRGVWAFDWMFLGKYLRSMWWSPGEHLRKQRRGRKKSCRQCCR